MISIFEFIKALSKAHGKQYNFSNVRVDFKEDGTYSSGNTKYKVLVISKKDNSVLIESTGMLLEKDNKTITMIDDSVLYNVEVNVIKG